MGQISLDQILSQVTASNSNLSAAESKIGSLSKQQQDVGNEAISATQAAASNDALVKQTENLALLKAQDRTTELIHALGISDNTNADIRVRLGKEYLDSLDQAKDAAGRIHQKEQTGFFDNPLEWIVNRYTIDKDYSDYNYAATIHNTDEKALAAINSLAQSTAATELATAKTKTAASVEAATQAVLQKAAVEAARIKQQNLALNIQAIRDIQSLDERKLSNLTAGFQAQNSATQLAMAQEQLELHRKQVNLSIQEHELKLQERQDNEEALNSYVTKINKGRALENLPPLLPREIKIKLLSEDKSSKERFQAWATNADVEESTGVRQIAGTPGDAAVQVIKNNSPLAPAQKPIKEYLLKITEAKALEIERLTGKKPTSQQVAEQVNLYLRGDGKENKGDLFKQAREIEYGKGNIYEGPGLKELGAVPIVANSTLYQKVLAPQIAAGNINSDPSNITALGVAAYAQGQISFKDLVYGTSVLYHAAVQHNNAYKDYIRLGMPPQTSYNVRVDNGKTLPIFNTDSVNFSNPVAVQDFYVKRIANQYSPMMIEKIKGESSGYKGIK